ncbi:alpha/beta fold hydrolase [Planomonospora algeriensis]
MTPIVFVHGIRVSATMWDPVRSRLDRPSAAVDLPGHGSRRGEPFTMEAAARAVADGIEGVAGPGGRAVVAGLSLGGYVGIAAAERFPDRVAGLVAMGCTASPGRRAGIYRSAASPRPRATPGSRTGSARTACAAVLPGPAGEALVAGRGCPERSRPRRSRPSPGTTSSRRWPRIRGGCGWSTAPATRSGRTSGPSCGPAGTAG